MNKIFPVYASDCTEEFVDGKLFFNEKSSDKWYRKPVEQTIERNKKEETSTINHRHPAKQTFPLPPLRRKLEEKSHPLSSFFAETDLAVVVSLETFVYPPHSSST